MNSGSDRVEGLSLFFPLHNEKDNIGALVASALVHAAAAADSFEIILVDDGSTDGTGPLADALVDRHPEVRVIHHPVNRGYGGALQSGIRASRYPWIFYSDGDNQFDLSEIPKLLALRQDREIVTGYRQGRKDAPHRLFFAWIFNRISHALFRVNVRDADCAFKLYRASIFQPMDLISQGAMIDVEILARARRDGARIAEVGVSHRAREHGDSSGGNPRVVLRAGKEMLRLWWAIRRSPKRG